jgi:hypothetical protein
MGQFDQPLNRDIADGRATSIDVCTMSAMSLVHLTVVCARYHEGVWWVPLQSVKPQTLSSESLLRLGGPPMFLNLYILLYI